MKNLELATKFKEFGITKSKHFPVIMEKYDLFGRHMSLKDFHKQYILPLDPAITYRQWYYFMGKLEDFQKSYIEQALKKSTEVALSEAKLEQNSLKNILQIADASLQTIAENPELIGSIPLNTRVRWFFQAMKARDSRAKTNLAQQQNEREQSMFEKIMEGAQYGGFDADAVPVDPQEVNQNQNAEEQPVPIGLPGNIQ